MKWLKNVGNVSVELGLFKCGQTSAYCGAFRDCIKLMHLHAHTNTEKRHFRLTGSDKVRVVTVRMCQCGGGYELDEN